MRTNRRFPIIEDMRFQTAWWYAERAAWLVLGLVVALALVGLFSTGFLSRTARSDPEGRLHVEYERFQRATVTTRFLVQIMPTPGEELRLRLAPPFQERYEVDSLQPTPMRSSASPQGLDLFFEPPETGALSVAIWAHPQRAGFFTLRLTNSAAGLELPVLVYP